MGAFEVCCHMLLAHACWTVSGIDIPAVSRANSEWWTNTIMYQVYPRSFKDSNKDGIGDFKGITQKLDHFVDLGIKTLWIGPFFKSPMDDMGYDVEDFKDVDPIFGTMEDLEELISEMKKRDLSLVTDLIPNHSSDKHKWFQKSINREGEYADYYVWRNASNQDEFLKNASVTPLPPNNWMSVFGGSGWTWDGTRNQFYFHQFNAKQPDFNIRNTRVQNEFLEILEFWMDKGIVGFRFDALKHLFESDTFKDEPYFEGKEGSNDFDDMQHIYTVDQPEVIEIIRDWRQFMDEYTKKNKGPPRLIATESYSSIDILMQYYGNETRPGAQIPFNFGLLQVDKNNYVQSIEKNVRNWMLNMPMNTTANWVIENHDNFRIPSKFGPELVPMFTALKLALPGIEVTYYGSEIGMHNTYVRKDETQDPNNAGGKRADESRDYERTPMQWDDSINAGFTEEKKSWLPVNPNYYAINVETQKKIPTSNYNFYKKMSQLRKTQVLKYGGLQTFNISDSIYIVKRSLPQYETYVVVFNFGSQTETVILSNAIKNINDNTFYVYLGSENSDYTEGCFVYTNSSAGNVLNLRPKSVVVLTDKFIRKPIDFKTPDDKNPEKTGSDSSSTQMGPTLICLLGAILFARFWC